MTISVNSAAGAKGNEVNFVTDANGNVTGLKAPGVSNRAIYAITDPLLPTLLIGGDHPFRQWWGTNGSNGLSQMYADQGIVPYIAINTGPTYTVDEDPTNYMSWEEIRALQTKAEIVAHGHRHVQDWRLVNTGITVQYTGAAATATVAITSTTISGTTAGGVDDFSFDMTTASYDTIAEVVAAIDALANWTASYASELLGTEASTNLLLRASVSAKGAPLYLAAGGGILITNTGFTFRDLTVNFNGSVLVIYGDGVRVLNLTLSGNTLTQVVTAINAVTGLTAELTNDTDGGSIKYCSGSEDSTCLAGSKWTGREPVPPGGIYIHAGLSHWYIVDRQLEKCKSVASSNGITLKNFAQSGAKFMPAETSGHNTYALWRGNQKTGQGIYPCAFIRNGNHIQHWAIDQVNCPAPATARFNAVLNALLDSPGFTVCVLMHNLYADGTSGYAGITQHPADYGATEAEWYAFLQSVAAARNAGTLRVMTLDEYRKAVPVGHGHITNLLFNARLHNSGESLRTAATDPGQIVPGWRLGTLTSTTSSASIDSSGFLSVTTTADTNPLEQVVALDPGVYEFRAQVESLSYTSGNGLVLYAKAVTPDFFVDQGLLPGINVWNTTKALRGKGEMKLRFSVAPPAAVPAIVISKNSQTYNLSTSKNIRLQIDSKTITGDIDCSAGASSASAVTAKEVAAAINAGMVAAASTYSTEYHTIAKAVNGKVVLTAPYISGDVIGTIYVADGTTAGARSTIFGDECYGVAKLSDYSQFGGLPITLGVEANMVGTVRIGAFSLRRVNA